MAPFFMAEIQGSIVPLLEVEASAGLLQKEISPF